MSPSPRPESRLRACVLLLLGLLGAARACEAAPEPVVAAAGCREVQVRSEGAGLREVLQKLSTTLRFELDYATSENPAVRVTGSHAPRQLMESLGRHANMAVQYRRDGQCNGELKILKVWVLPQGASPPAVAPLHVAPISPAPAVPAVPATPAPSPSALEQFQRAHGMQPGG